MLPQHVSVLAACAIVLSLPGLASAQEACFAVSGSPAAEGRAQHLVGLADTVRLSASCEFSLRAHGPFAAPGELATREVDFLEVHHHLVATAGAGQGDPRLIFARPTGRGAEGQQHTLMLRYCAHYLLEERLGFRVAPEAGSGGLRIQRVSPAGCDASQLELRVSGSVGADLLTGTSPAHTMPAGQAVLELPQGDWSIYAARPGSAVALRIGVFRSQRVVTPLQNHLRTVGMRHTTDAPPLLAARWTPGGPGMLLHPSDFALRSDLLWPELRTAADAGVLWLARRTGDGDPVVIDTVQLEAGTSVPTVRLPDSAVRAFMRREYGELAAASLVPTSDDWRGVFRDLAMCLTPSYHQAHNATIGSAVPSGSACASFGGLAVLAQVEGAGDVPARLCLRHAPQRMRADGMRQDLPDEPDCFRLAEPGSTDPDPWRVAVAGDRVALEGTGLCVLIDGSPIEPVEGSEEYVLHAGLLEVRQGGGAGCGSPQAIARLRLPVLDPEHEWHPVGLYTDASEEAMACTAAEGLVCPWRAIAHDENDTYAYIEPHHELELRLSTSAPVAAAVDHANGGARRLTQDVTVLSGVHGDFGGSRGPAVVAHVTRENECPTETFEELRQRPPLDVDDLLTDATFNVFLLAVSADDAPTTCLAHARFRARSSRAFVAATVVDALGFEVGVLGDAQAVFFGSSPIAMGVMLPIGWFRFTPGIRFLALDISANLTMAASFPQGGLLFPDAYLSRVGVSLSWALSIGIPEYLPRILSVGGMLHGAAETNPIEDPIISFYVGLNLATLVDLAGGR